MPAFKRKHKINIFLENPPNKDGFIDKVDVQYTYSHKAKFLNTAEACEFLGISNRQIRRYIADNKIPFEIKDKRYRFSVKKLHKWALEKGWKKGIVGNLVSGNTESDKKKDSKKELYWFN